MVLKKSADDCAKEVYEYEKAYYWLMKQRLNVDWGNFLGADTD